jgi:hypothetical protein
MGAAAFTLASTVEQAFGNWCHRVTSVMGTEPVPAPLEDVAQRYPIAPGPMAVGNPGGGKVDQGLYWPTWSAVARALPMHTVRPVGGGYDKPDSVRFTAATAGLPSDVVNKPEIKVRTGAGQGRVTTSPKAQMRWVRQGG